MAAAVLPRGPRPHFLTGNLPEFRRDPLDFFVHAARQYGDFVPVRFPGARGAVLSHPDYIEEVLVAQHRNFVKSVAQRKIRSVVGNGLVLSEGEFWRRQRRLAQPAFHRERVAAYGGVMVAYAERMLNAWQDGETRDVHQEMMRLTLEIVVKTLFDAEVAGEAGAVGAALDVITAHFASRFTSILFLLPDSVPTPGNLRLKRAVRRLDGIIYAIIDQRRAGGEDRGDLLSLLLRARDEEDRTGMTDRQLRDEVMTLMLAGHETTALALSWAWYLLTQHPVADAKLTAELAAVLGGRAPGVADLPRLRYTEMVVSESLRLYPPAWALSRDAVQDCEVGGYPVRAGTSLVMSPWAMHRDPRYFDEPEAFKPDRWADGLAKRLPKYAYFPFGGGPRICIGNTFAMMEAALVLATVAQRFRLTLVPEHPVTPQPSVTLRPKHGVKMVLHRR